VENKSGCFEPNRQSQCFKHHAAEGSPLVIVMPAHTSGAEPGRNAIAGAPHVLQVHFMPTP